MVSGNAFGLEFVIRIVHISQNTDLNNVVLVVGIMAVDFDCAWGAFTQLQWIRVAKKVFWRRLWGAATCNMPPGDCTSFK